MDRWKNREKDGWLAVLGHGWTHARTDKKTDTQLCLRKMDGRMDKGRDGRLAVPGYGWEGGREGQVGR